MENALLVTGLTVGGLLAFPLCLEWLHKFQVGLVMTAALLVGLYGLAPYSASARGMVSILNTIPKTFAEAATSAEDNVAKLSSGYFNAFRG